MNEERIRKILQDSMKKMDFQVITLDGKNYCVFNDKQIKDFFKNTAETVWKGIMEIIKTKIRKSINQEAKDVKRIHN